MDTRSVQGHCYTGANTVEKKKNYEHFVILAGACRYDFYEKIDRKGRFLYNQFGMSAVAERTNKAARKKKTGEKSGGSFMKTKRGKLGRVLLAVALMLMILLTACAAKPKKASQRLELGQKYLNEMNYTEAVDAFTQVIQLYPENIPAYMGRAQAYAGLEQYEKAKDDYTEVIEKAKTAGRSYTEVQAYMGRAKAYELLQENSEAVSDYECARVLLEQTDWSESRDATDDIIQELQDQIEEDCQRLQEQLSIENADDASETASIFQNAMDNLVVDSKYANSQRYVIPADYDGDGRVEAFGFLGSKMNKDGLLVDVQVYFIDPDGQVEKVTEISGIDGAPNGMKSENQTDFSDCLMVVNDHIYAVFMCAPQEIGEYFTEVFGVRNGRYTVKEMGGVPTVRKDGLVEVPDLGFSVVYQEEDGVFKQVGIVEEENQPLEQGLSAGQNGSVSLEQAWEQTKQTLIQQTGWSGSGYSDYFFPADYDGDGRQEAFAVYGDFQDGLANNFRIYFISASGAAIQQTSDDLWSGRVFHYREYDGTADSVLVKAGNRRVFVWEMPGAGNMPTIFFGVKNGVPYYLDISMQYAWFTEEDGHYYVSNGSYEDGDYEIEYNAATGQFELNGNVKHYE